MPVPRVDVASRVCEEGPHGLAVAGVRRGEDILGQENERLAGRELLRAFLLQKIRRHVHREHATIAIAVVIVARVAGPASVRSEHALSTRPWARTTVAPRG